MFDVSVNNNIRNNFQSVINLSALMSPSARLPVVGDLVVAQVHDFIGTVNDPAIEVLVSDVIKC